MLVNPQTTEVKIFGTLCGNYRLRISNLGSCTSFSTEAEYAFLKNKTIIPLKVDDDFEPSGWLGPLIGARLYYRMDTEALLLKNFPDLRRAIGDRGLGVDAVDCQGKLYPCFEEDRKAICS